MDTLHKNEISIIVKYLDHTSIKEFAQFLLQTDPRQACNVLTTTLEELIIEREEIEQDLCNLTLKLESIEELSGQIYNAAYN